MAICDERHRRVDFVSTPKHGSWLNLVGSFFGKLARMLLRGMRIASKEELKHRIEQHLPELNDSPVVFRWRYRMEETLGRMTYCIVILQ